jgi:type I restriction enzyme S subunit
MVELYTMQRFLDPEGQSQIVSYINDQLYGINIAVARALREIELLQEFRICLIDDVVTGNLDVREASARLPDEAVVIDETEDFPKLDEEIETEDVEDAVAEAEA